jgi:hypothetical protein
MRFNSSVLADSVRERFMTGRTPRSRSTTNDGMPPTPPDTAERTT